MEEMKCTCGGTFQCLGPEYLRTGNIHFLVDKDAEERCIPGMLFVCERCSALRFCADVDWLRERRTWWEKERPKVEQEQQFQSDRFTAFLRDFAEYSDKKLERIAAPSLFSGYDEVARAAARQLLAERKTNSDAVPQSQEREHDQQPESSCPSWTRRKDSKPPWEG